jgi:hypothetical protein
LVKIFFLKLSIEDKLVLATAKLNPTDAEIKSMDELIVSVYDWEYFTDAVIRNSLGPLAYRNFSYTENYSLIPEETISKFKQQYIVAFDHNKKLYEHFFQAVNAFSDQGIQVIALKGIFLAETIYQDTGLRPMSDIDLLVKKEDALKCASILKERGYTTREIFKSDFTAKNSLKKHLPPLVSGNVSIELHVQAHVEDPEYSVEINDYWKNARSADIAKTRTLALSPGDLLQYLCIHLDYHFYCGMILLYQYCDIAGVIKFYKNEFDWNDFIRSCEKYNCSKSVYRQLFIAHKYFETPLPSEILADSNFYCDQPTERLFLLYLKGETKDISKEIMHGAIRNIKIINGTRKKIIFLIHDIFPSYAFMKRRYQVKNPLMIFLYYLIRIKTGIFVLIKYFLKGQKGDG